MKIRYYKKRYFITIDNNGNKIYVGDVVEIHNTIETKTPHKSKVHWTMLSGAFIDSHPAHISLHEGKNYHRRLIDYLNNEWCTCVKVKSFNK